MSTITSASDRYEAARRALDLHESRSERATNAQMHLAEALRALIQPPAVDNHPDDLADAWATRLYERGTIEVLGEKAALGTRTEATREAYLQGIRAGIQAAWESWESETAPTAETRTVHIVFDGPPAPESGRFVEVETPDGQGIHLGRWIERADGYWALEIEVPA